MTKFNQAINAILLGEFTVKELEQIAAAVKTQLELEKSNKV